MLEKQAHLCAQLGHFSEGVETYEKIAKISVESSTLRFSTKNFLMNAALCIIATQVSFPFPLFSFFS
jgi:hypothetical protein